MILRSVQIRNFKCIEDSGEFRLDRVTCLVGKNESGKSAVLQAMYKLNPVIDEEGRFDEVVEYPRRRWSVYKERREDDPDTTVITKWELDDSDRQAITDVLGSKALLSPEVTISKGYDNVLRWSIPLDERQIVAHMLAKSNLHTEEAKPLRNASTVTDLIKRIEAVQARSERQETFIQQLKTVFPKGNAWSGGHKILGTRLPKFLYFPDYEKMRGQVALSDLLTRKAQNRLEFSDRIFLALLELAGTTLEELQNIGKLEHLYAELEGVSNRITETIFQYWSQNRHLEIQFGLDQARPNDPPPFNSGLVFQTRIRNARHRVSVNFDERSTGFVWFFSFLVWFSQLRRNYGERLVVLLDEPGLSLHAKAQQDLLRYINERLAPLYQVVYSTHSPFMIDPEKLLSVRIVEDVVKDSVSILGTKVREDVLATDADTVFPLQAALGYDITQTLFVGKNILLVEGPSDLLYLKWFSNELWRCGREGLDRQWVITPCGGIDKVAGFLALFGANDINVAALTDFHPSVKNKVRNLRESELHRLSRVFTANMYVDQEEADLEDLLGRELYFELVNRCFGLSETCALKGDSPRNGERLVKEVEDHFRCLPPHVDEFDHYAPAVYLVENGGALRDEFPGFGEALERFERLFSDVNSVVKGNTAAKPLPTSLADHKGR